MEAWCAMQTATTQGLLPCGEAERRYEIRCIHNALMNFDDEGLVAKLSKKTPQDMYTMLRRPDVLVTNAKDVAIWDRGG